MSDTPNYDEVICPNCVHQFRAIPENVQAELNQLRHNYALMEEARDAEALKVANRDAEIADLRCRLAEAEQPLTDAGFAGYGEETGQYTIPVPAFKNRMARVILAAERAGMERAVKALSSMRWGLGFSYDRAYDDAISQGIDVIRALIPEEDDREQNYLMGGCTETECLLCHTPKYARKPGMHHAGISVWQEADRG